jgi:hypothetical protein
MQQCPKVTSALLLRKFAHPTPQILWTLDYSLSYSNKCLLSLNLSHTNPVHTVQLLLNRIQYNIILPSMPMFSKWSFILVLQPKFFTHHFHAPPMSPSFVRHSFKCNRLGPGLLKLCSLCMFASACRAPEDDIDHLPFYYACAVQVCSGYKW